MHSAISILRAAAADGNDSWFLPPPSSPITPPRQGSDLLTALVLNLAAFLLAEIPPDARSNIGLFAGTTLGSLEADRIFDRSRRESHARYASPAAFSRTLPSTIPAELPLVFQLTGPTLVLSAGGQSAATALRRAAAWMLSENLDLCLAGACDNITPNGGAAESPRAAFLLLARNHPGIGELRITPPPALALPDLGSTHDLSLAHLIQGIQRAHPCTLGAGVHVALSGRR